MPTWVVLSHCDFLSQSLINITDYIYQPLSQLTDWLHGLNNRYLFFTVLEAKKSKIKMPAYFASAENPLPGLQTSIFSLQPQMTYLSSTHMKRERVRFGLSSSSYEDTIPIIGILPTWTYLDLITSQRPHLPIPLRLRLVLQHMNSGLIKTFSL